MRYGLILFCFVMVPWCASAEISPSQKVDPAKLRYTLVNALLAQASAPLKNKKMCESFVKNGHETVGAFVAWSVSFYSDGQSNSLSASCENGYPVKLCTVQFFADSKGESPWACGLRFKFDTKKQKMDANSLECVGTC